MATIASDSLTRFEIEGLLYELDRPPSKQGRRSVATVRLAELPEDPGFTDRVDFFAFKSRHTFATRVADAFGRQAGVIMGHLALILDAVERAHATDPQTRPEELTPERRAAAVNLLEQPGLLDKAAGVMDGLGYVGEGSTKRLAFLVATSRLLAKPLSAILRASSGCGKSELLEVVTRLLPAEAVEFVSRISPAALYYAGERALSHKVVVVDEAAGSAEADYAIRTLQSKGLLRLMVPTKGKAEPFTVYGPISLMSGTTSEAINPENLSRCLELTLDDSPEQTRRIQEAQARAWSGKTGIVPDTQVWQDAQRLLEQVDVVIPFAQELRFPARTTADRRGSTKLLGLVAAHALLHQRQRDRDAQGKIVATVGDYAVVYELLQPSVAQDLDGLPPRAARAYRLLLERDVPMTRREIAGALGWNYMTAARALDDLVTQELGRAVDAGVPRRYQALAQGSALGSSVTLRPPSELA